MSGGSEFQVCGAATENARRANSVRVLAADSIGASEDRRGRAVDQKSIAWQCFFQVNFCSDGPRDT